MTVRVRIAPSPTGLMHIGNARAALFNWLFAKNRSGVFVVRIDDTDPVRSESQYEDDILEGFRWLGLDWQEGVGVGGPFGSYRQSDRFDRYRQAAEELVDRGHAYPCFCTPEELEARRQEAEAASRPPGYDGRCRLIPPDSAAARRAAGELASIRFAMPRPGSTTFIDLVRGEVTFDHEHVDDYVLLRSDGSPTYHLASTVDDVDYGITHVVRGEDLLPSTPRHIQLTIALGGDVATYAHLPLLMGPDGKRLSKRHGATSLRFYREGGYLHEALVNYLSLLGWSPGDDRTIFSVEEAIPAFDLADVSKHAAVFDPDKLEWMNGEYIRALDSKEFCERVRPFLEEGLGRGLTEAEWADFIAIAPLVQERVKLLTEAAGQVGFLYADEIQYDPVSWEKVMRDRAGEVLAAATESLEKVDLWEHDTIEAALRSMLEELALGAKQGLQPVRVAVTGSSISPPLFESISVLGKQRTMARLEAAKRRL
ncbi:MAG TPA: glutamate--tRNA ligase [Acidimicrobiia bacterium]